jgi:TatD DNase family protein
VIEQQALVDSHCHLDFPEYDGHLDEIRKGMEDRGVSHAMCISINLAGFPKVLSLAERYSNFFATVGIHPDQKPDEPGASADMEELVRLARHPKVLAVGETGLDYHWHKDAPEWQRERFRIHIRAARASGKPLVIHTREAADDTLRIMREEGADKASGVMHCFTETLAVAQTSMAMGFYISFSGIVTFKNARELQETARAVPLDRMLVETDSPFLSPVPHRGQTNQPGFTRHVAEAIASLKGISPDEVAAATTANFQRLFGVNLS